MYMLELKPLDISISVEAFWRILMRMVWAHNSHVDVRATSIDTCNGNWIDLNWANYTGSI